MYLGTTIFYGNNVKNIINMLSERYEFDTIIHDEDNLLKIQNENLVYEEILDENDFCSVNVIEINGFSSFLQNIGTPDGSDLVNYLISKKILFKTLFWYFSDQLAQKVCSKDELGRHIIDTKDIDVTVLFDFPVCDLIGEKLFRVRKVVDNSYAMSHDIDYLKRYYFTCRGILRFIKDLVYLIERRDLDWTINSFKNFQFFQKIAAENGIKSAYFFMTGLGRHALDGNTHMLDDMSLQKAAFVIKHGHLFGLHPSILARSNLSLFQAEIDRYLEICEKLDYSGPRLLRMHFLQEISDDFLLRLDELNFMYESSKGFSNYIGYRLGTRFPVKCYIKSKSCLTKNLSFYPLIIMDTVVLSKMSVAELSNKYAFKRSLCDRGDTLWHNSNLKVSREVKLAGKLLK